jgi:hypothetical protein
MYLRFSIERRDEDSGRGLGIFHAAGELRDHGSLEEWEANSLWELRDWFNNHLDKPDRFTASKPPFYRKQSKGIAWFKDTATEHIARIREMVTILERHGITVHTFRTERVGYVVYEDEFQIVAEPFSDVIC